MRHHRSRFLVAALASVLVACGGSAPAATGRSSSVAGKVVTDWVEIVERAIHNPQEPRGPASAIVLHTVVHLAVYDAVVAIEGGFRPYHRIVEAPEGADVPAAVATAAYRSARERVAASQHAYLDGLYEAFMAMIPDGKAKQDGVAVGEAAASGILQARSGDGLNNPVAYQCSADPLPAGEFEPNGGCGTQPAEMRVGQMKPYTFDSPSEFRPDGPDPFTSNLWVKDFNEVKDYGRADSNIRTPEQTDVAYFWSEHGYVHWNRNLIALTTVHNLDALEAARLFAMAGTAASDAAIAGLEAKFFYRTWRPRTAIPRAGEDGDPRTEPDPTWTPLLTVNHPEYPAAHGFISTALTDAVARFFGTDKVEWTITTSKGAVPQLVRNERTYKSMQALIDDVADARVWSGLHYRNSMDEGEELGHRVAAHVLRNHFRAVG